MTATLSLALKLETATVKDVALVGRLKLLMVGALVSAFLTVTVTVDDVLLLPLASTALAVRV